MKWIPICILMRMRVTTVTKMFFFLLRSLNTSSTMCVCTISFRSQIFFTLHLHFIHMVATNFHYHSITIALDSPNVITIPWKFIHNFVFITYLLFLLCLCVALRFTVNTHQKKYDFFLATTTLLLLLPHCFAFLFFLEF